MAKLHIDKKSMCNYLIVLMMGSSSLSFAAECPAYLSKFRPSYLSKEGIVSLLEVCERYQKAKQKLSSLNLDAENLVGALAPRFIKLDEWHSKKVTQNY